MARSMIRCIDNRAYLREGPDGRIYMGPVDDETLDLSLTIGKVYVALNEDEDSYQIVDDTGEAYFFPKYMFERLS